MKNIRWLLLTLLVFVVCAGPASAETLSGYAFTPQNTTASRDTGYGTFDEQVNFSLGPKYYWSFLLSPAYQVLAKNSVSENASMTCSGKNTGYDDTHPAEAPNYLFHSTFGPLNTSCNYELHVTIQYETKADAILTINLTAPYYISYA